jgi:hypothetical protein
LQRIESGSELESEEEPDHDDEENVNNQEV